VFNQASGKAAEWAARVNANDPANSILVLEAINAGAATDATLKDYDTFAQIEADANAAEVTNGGYARKTFNDSTGGITVTIDDTNDRTDVDVPDQTWTAVASGTTSSTATSTQHWNVRNNDTANGMLERRMAANVTTHDGQLLDIQARQENIPGTTQQYTSGYVDTIGKPTTSGPAPWS
jgi:hypothetical protein